MNNRKARRIVLQALLSREMFRLLTEPRLVPFTNAPFPLLSRHVQNLSPDLSEKIKEAFARGNPFNSGEKP